MGRIRKEELMREKAAKLENLDQDGEGCNSEKGTWRALSHGRTASNLAWLMTSSKVHGEVLSKRWAAQCYAQVNGSEQKHSREYVSLAPVSGPSSLTHHSSVGQSCMHIHV